MELTLRFLESDVANAMIRDRSNLAKHWYLSKEMIENKILLKVH